MFFLMLHVFHCIPLYFHFAVRHLKFGISKSSSIAAEEPPKLTVPSMWPCLERRQLLCGLKSIHEWMCSHVKLTMVVYYTTSTAHSMEPVSLCCPHELLKFREKKISQNFSIDEEVWWWQSTRRRRHWEAVFFTFAYRTFTESRKASITSSM